ncbi:MAG: muramoyltetrapeptide carboxypeptidase LdcA involved in peptidoglycan recycling [Natronomonas sp.]|jgi:muramoyltetrapeptide carboxypeptidase LdcA involved in peptidoglycan recycling
MDRPDSFVRPPAASPGDTVAVIAPASGLAALFPEILDLAVDRLQEQFDVNPQVYPTAEKDPEYLFEHPEERARDVHDAFQDPDVSAVFATIGGADQIRVLKHLDPGILRENPTRFFGTSDNSCLASYLWGCGLVSYYGGTLLSDVATPGSLPEYTERYLRRALFNETLGPLESADEWTDEPVDWADDDYRNTEPTFEKNPGRQWHAPQDTVVEGRLWGGCLTVLHALLAGDRAVPSPNAIDGDVLAIETSEELPSPDEVGLMLTCLGERGLLERFDAVLVGRPQTRSHEHDPGTKARETYRTQQRSTIRDIVNNYNSDAVIVSGLDFGHTSPTAPVPIGDRTVVDPATRTIDFPKSY